MRPLALLLLLVAIPVLAADKPPASSPPSAPMPLAARKIEVKVTQAGFEPRELTLKKGEATTIIFTRVTDRTCITAIDIPDEGVKGFPLPLNRPAYVTVTPKKPGVEKFHCTSMAMGDGRLVVGD